MKIPVAELYRQHPFDETVQVWASHIPLKTSIAYAEDLHVQSDPIGYLDEMATNDYKRVMGIRDALLALPPRVVIEDLGEDIAVWSSLTSVMSGENDEMNRALETELGYDVDDLAIARGWMWRHNYDSKTKRTMTQYRLMQAVRRGISTAVDMPEVLCASARPGVMLSPKRLEDYAIEPVEVKDYNTVYDGGPVEGWAGEHAGNIAYDAWLDAPTGFGLTYKGRLSAMVGLAVSQAKEVMVYQLQGIQAHRVDPTKSLYSDERDLGPIASRGLAPLDWQQVMVTITEQFAAQFGAEGTGIQSAHNNVWIKKRMPGDTAPHLPIEKAKQAYDAVAHRLGYTMLQDDPLQNWHKSIS